MNPICALHPQDPTLASSPLAPFDRHADRGEGSRNWPKTYVHPLLYIYFTEGSGTAKINGIKEVLDAQTPPQGLHNSAKEGGPSSPRACCYNTVDAGGILEDHPGYIQLMVHKHVSTRNQPCDALYRNSISGRGSSSGQPGFSRRGIKAFAVKSRGAVLLGNPLMKQCREDAMSNLHRQAIVLE